MAKDPVCGMLVNEAKEKKSDYKDQTYYFCSDYCQRLFEKAPEKYVERIQADSLQVEKERTIAYFSMEVAVHAKIPTYSGGLGILAGDTLRSCADLKVPIAAVTLFYEKGYFQQCLDEQGNQDELPVEWNPTAYLKPLLEKVEIQIGNRSVLITGWQYDVIGSTGYSVPVIFLDANLEENRDEDKELTHYLYGGNEAYRLAQEIILGIGGIRMLRKLGFTNIKKYHMNEGHASLLVMEFSGLFNALLLGHPVVFKQ